MPSFSDYFFRLERPVREAFNQRHILTSDVVYLKESLEKDLIPPIPGTWSPMGMYQGYQKVRIVRDAENASVFFAHDPDVFKATKQAPAFYE